jgi:hypothetical protein
MGTTLGTGEGAGQVGEHPFSQRAWRGGGECALGQASMEHDTIHEQVASVRGHYLSLLRTFTTDRQRSLEFDQVLSGR